MRFIRFKRSLWKREICYWPSPGQAWLEVLHWERDELLASRQASFQGLEKKKKRPSICQNINIPLPMPNRSPLSLPLSVTGNTSPHAARVSHDEASHPRTCDHVCIFTTLGIWQATWREDLPSKSIFTRTQGRNFGELIGVES